MEEQEFEFSIEKPKQEFGDHLNLPNNDRIVLSAPFGAGKTYFLKEFFKDHHNYEAIHLYPVNYAVASNTDIFELVKYDILFELMGKGVEFEEMKFNRVEFLPFFLQGNIADGLEVLTPLFSAIPKVGRAITGFSDRLIALGQKFEKELKEVQIDDLKSVISYLKSSATKKGSIYEDDFYTQLIRQLVNQLKVEIQSKEEESTKKQPEKKQLKKTVLIIDDLDRIDPEHIFRILNVFSAQMDKDGQDNKFDFDKIILVFDQENVRNMFTNKYGADVDYTGYIDKFYSYKIFEFFNLEGVMRQLRKLLNTLDVRNRRIDFLNRGDLVTGIIYVLEKLIEANVLTKRRLIKLFGATFNYKFQEQINRNLAKVLYIRENQINILFVTRFLLFIYEDWDDLISALKKINKPANDDLEGPLYRLIEECIVYSDRKNHMFNDDRSNSKEEYTFNSPEKLEKIKYQLDNDFDTRAYKVKINQRINVEELFNEIFIHTVEQIREDNMFDLKSFL